MTVLAFADVVKAPADVETVSLDWSALAPTGQTSFDTHSVAVTCGDVTVQDTTSGTTLVQKVKVSAGTCGLRSVVEATVTFADGTTLTRGFEVIVR